MENHENLGKEKAVIKTVFAYKINVGIAAILLFINVQTLVSVALELEVVGTTALLTSTLLTLASLAYGLLSLNGFLTKIIVYEGGFVMKSLFRETVIYGGEIKKAVFNRVNMRKMKITISIEDDDDIKINSAKYVDIVPLVEFLANYKG